MRHTVANLALEHSVNLSTKRGNPARHEAGVGPYHDVITSQLNS
jgi:hypothetical protein